MDNAGKGGSKTGLSTGAGDGRDDEGVGEGIEGRVIRPTAMAAGGAAAGGGTTLRKDSPQITQPAKTMQTIKKAAHQRSPPRLKGQKETVSVGSLVVAE